MPEIILNYNEMSRVLSDLEERVKDCNKRAYEIRDQDITVETFGELKKKNLAEVYGKVIDTYTEVGFMLSETASSLMDMRTLRKQVGAIKNIPASLQQQIRARIEYIVKDLEDTQKSLSYMKDVYDAKIRFYNSSQYLISGTRFQEKL